MKLKKRRKKMSKLINTPHECGLRTPVHGYSICTHKLNRNKKVTACLDPNNFPEKCPLQDSIPIPKTSLPGEYRNDLPGNRLILKPALRSANIPHPKKRRDRKDCKHYELNNECSAPWKDGFNCIGVNCGSFEQ